MTNSPRSCPKCGSTLPADAPEGLCPACLMRGGLDTDATIKLTPSQMRTPSHGPVAPPPEELAPLFPQLEIIELLGRGGMGAVYKARQPKLNRFVALKIIAGDAAADPHFAERFQREAQALAKLNHPHIVSVFDFGETGGLFYFLMEFVDGANLRTLMQSGEMKPEAALALIPAFCDALQYAHDEGVVHRDIKPENVLVDKKGRLKIADFGLAKLTGADAHDHTLTRTGMYLGTPRYMAPEQVEKPETVDHRADIYSLGVVFYEMLTGELPMGRFDPPSKKVDVDVKLDDIVLRSLEKEPARRYQHASEIKTDVEGLGPASSSSDLKPREAVPHQTGGILPRHPGALPSLICTGLGLLAAAVVFVLVSNVAWYWGLRKEGEPDFPPRFLPFIFTCLPLGILLSASGTVWGWRVVRTIAASPSQWSGRGMAFAAAITVPVLIVDVLVSAVIDGVATFIGRLAQWDYPTIASLWSALSIPACAFMTIWLVARIWRHLFASDNKADRPHKGVIGPRLSRMALIGAIWALFGLIAVIPSVLLTKTVEFSQGSPSSLVYEQPSVAFTVFMAVLLFIGAGAPIGTTILGAISMSKIKKSGGKLYGLPLAFADTVFFPMLLLHGAMAVMLGLLILTIMKLADVNAGLGATEMGLLAMLPLFADFFIVRALWRRMAGTVTAPASPPPASTASNPLRNWVLWFGTAVIFVIAFVATFLLQDSTGTGGKGSPGLFASSAPLIVAEKIETRETDHDLCRYKISAPPDHRVAVWLEVTREGKPVVLPGLANQISFAEQHQTGEAFDGHAEFSLMDGSRISPDSKGKWRWDFKFDSGKGRFTPGGWIDNPFDGKAGRIMDLGPERWQPKPGETVSIMVIRAGREFSGSDFTQQPPGGEIELRLKARIDLVPLFHRRVSGISSTSSATYPTPERPLARIAAGFGIDTKLSDDDIRRALIEKLKTNPDKRRDAEAILKSIGKPITQETTPEDVLKALEKLAQEQTPAGMSAPSTNAKPAANNAAALLRQVSEKYGALTTLGVTGKSTTQMTAAGGGEPSKLENTFSINLARPEFYRIEWKQPLAGTVVSQGAVWSTGSGHRVLIGQKVSEWLHREQALGAATGVSGGAANTLPRLFFKDAGSGLHEFIQNATFQPDESVGGEPCQVITGDGHGGKLKLWVTRKDLFVKQIQMVTSGDGGTQEAGHVSSETMAKIAKTLGGDASPEAVSKMTREIEAAQKLVAAMRTTITETFERVVANEMMVKADFEVAVPAGTSGPK